VKLIFTVLSHPRHGPDFVAKAFEVFELAARISDIDDDRRSAEATNEASESMGGAVYAVLSGVDA